MAAGGLKASVVGTCRTDPVEDITYPYLSDSMAREHAHRMMAEGSRRRPSGSPRAGLGTHRLATVAHAATWPMTAVRGWLAAGQL